MSEKSDNRFHNRLIKIRAENVREDEEHEGHFFVEIPCAPMSEEESKMLARLFPHSERQVDILLQREAMLAAIVED